MTPQDAETGRLKDLRTRRSIIDSTDRSMLVEAAAGTGKTTLVTERILSGIRKGLFRLPEVVAITFTEKAAGELESRLRRELNVRVHQQELPEHERRNIARAIEELDQAYISTIHSFCGALLRERPIEAGVDPEFEVLDETQADLLREHCWDSWMSEQIQACEPALVDALRAGIGISGDPRSFSLKGLADAVVKVPEVLDASLFRLDRPERGVEELLGVLKEHGAKVVGYIARNVRGEGNVHVRALRDAAQRITEIPIHDTIALRTAAYGLLARVKVESTLTSFPKELRDEAAGVFGELAATAGEVAAHLACDLLGWIGGFVSFYGEEKRRRSALDFHDLLLYAARLLRTNKSVRSYFKDRFSVLFVDEFQDTDPLQAEAVAFLCERRGGSADRPEDVELEQGKLFVVGDPKQSIYRFRGADVQVYEQFKRLFERLPSGEESVRVVSRNFRSTAALIASLNAVFERVFAGGGRKGVYQAEHVPLVPNRDEDRSAPAVIALYPPDQDAEDLKKAESARTLEARHLARVVRDMVEGRAPSALVGATGEEPLGYGGFACLLRALTDVEIYEEAFEKSGVPYRVVGGRSYYQREEIGETLAVLRAVDDPLDQIAVVGALRSSYFAVSDEELFRYKEAGGLWNYLRTEVDEGPAGEAMDLLSGWHARRNRVPPHVLLREILDCTKALEAFMLKPAGRQRLANVQKLVGQLRSLHMASAGTFRSIIDYLATLHERREAEEESSVVEPGDDFVLLMSIHKAKGLEFDAVCLPDLSRGLRDDVGPLVVDRLGRRVELSAGTCIRSRGYEELAQLERENVLEEQKRLLYVGATRARRLLILPLYWQRSDKGCTLKLLAETGCFAGPEDVPFGEAREGVFYWDTRVAEPDIEPSARPAGPMAGRAPAAELPGRRRQWRQEHDEIVLRSSQRPPIILPSELAEGPAEWVGPAAAGGEGREFGSLFHSVMRRMPLKEVSVAEELEALAGGMAAMEAAAMGLDEGTAREAARLVIALIQDGEFGELVRGAEVVLQEVPIAVPLRALPFFGAGADGLLEARIDLLLMGGERTVVLDYKTDRLEAEAEGRAASRYWPQLALYALALDACGWLRAQSELVLCFVRGTGMRTRQLDEALLEETERRLKEALAGAGLG